MFPWDRRTHLLLVGIGLCCLSKVYSLPQRVLSATGLYADILHKRIAPENLGYEPQYPLWTDGAEKKRWIFLPVHSQIITANDGGDPFQGDIDHWKFPLGTKFWKEFSFPLADGSGLKRVETRLMEKVDEVEWEFATYLWDERESEAILAPEEGVPDYYPTSSNTKHNIPSVSDCLYCHSRGGDPILGFDALQLSADRDPLSPHAKPVTDEMVTLKTLIDWGTLSSVPDVLTSHPPRIVASNPQGRAAMGYLHSNCGSCHNDFGNGGITKLRFRYPMGINEESNTPTFRTAVNQLTLIFKIPDQMSTYQILSGDPDHSAVLFRMKAQGNSSHMPPIGAKLADVAAIELINGWIKRLSNQR